MNDPIQQFKTAMFMSGIMPPDLIETDGKINRFPSGDSKNDKNGWYVFHAEPVPAGAYGCWQRGINETWQAKSHRALTPSEVSAQRIRMESVKQQREAEKLNLQAQAKAKAQDRWSKADREINHPYVIAKQIKPYGIRQFADSLLIPLYDNGEIVSLQIIHKISVVGGIKRFLTGGKVAGCYFPIGNINNAKVLCICEGYATGATIHEATGYPVVIAFTANNLKPVTKAMRNKYPNLKVIVCGDDDWKTASNAGVAKAKACGGLVVFPQFGADRKDKETDFNDLAIRSGLEAVRETIDSEQAMGEAVSKAIDFGQDMNAVAILIRASELSPLPIDWVWYGWLASGKFHLLGGVAGTGKTTLALYLASVITTGGTFPDGTRAQKGQVVIWTGEDDICDTLTPRLMAMGADRDKVHFVENIKTGAELRPFDPSLDMPLLKQAITKIDNVKLLIIDPIVSVVKGDSHKNAEVRKDLTPLIQMAESSGFAIIGITHFSKGTAGREPIERITGSLAFGAVARVVLVASKTQNEEGEDVRIFLRAKSNIGADDGGFEYSLEQATTNNGIETSQVKWGEALEGSARELLGEAEEECDGGGIEGCMSLIHDLLKYGEISTNQMEKDCKGAGYSLATTRRAKKKLGVQSRKTEGSKGFWVWCLPKKLNMLKDAHTQNVNTLNTLGEIEPPKANSQIIEGEL